MCNVSRDINRLSHLLDFPILSFMIYAEALNGDVIKFNQIPVAVAYR